MIIIKSSLFSLWYDSLDMSQKIQVDTRLTKILVDSHFGLYKRLGNICELKFRSGIRIYYAFDKDVLVLLLNGGGKTSKRKQSQDIEKAREIFKEYFDGK